jgi:hypothetical protein
MRRRTWTGRQTNSVPGPDERAVAPAVGKTLEIGIVVLFVGFLTASLLGGVVPDYRTATGAEVGERVLATTGQEIERAVPPTARDVSVRRTVELPARIAGSSYTVSVDGRSLVLDHPDPAIGGRFQLSLPSTVDRAEGRADDGGQILITVSGDSSGLVVELTDGGPR